MESQEIFRIYRLAPEVVNISDGIQGYWQFENKVG